MRTKRLEVISVLVTDQQRSLEFYRGRLGFHIVNDSTFPDDQGKMQRWIQLAASAEAETSITLVSWFPAMPAGSMHGAVLWVDDIESTRNELIAAGIEMKPVFETPWGKFAGFSDPDGNGWSLHST